MPQNLVLNPVHVLWAQHLQRPHEGYVYEIFKSEEEMKATFQALTKKTTGSGFVLNMSVKHYTAAALSITKKIVTERSTIFINYDRNKNEAFQNILQNFVTKFEDLWKTERKAELLCLFQEAVDSPETMKQFKKIENLLLDGLLIEKLHAYGELVYMATKVWDLFCRKWALSKIRTYIEILENEIHPPTI